MDPGGGTTGSAVAPGAAPTRPAAVGAAAAVKAMAAPAGTDAAIPADPADAAAASDGRLDAAERQRILGGMKTAGVGDAAEQFLARELASPASPEDLARAAGSPEEAVQIYTAARLAIEVDTSAERSFLAALAAAANVDPELSAHVDAAARSA